jgi:hypothetical protein
MSPDDTAAQARQLASQFLQLSMAVDRVRADKLTTLSQDDLHRLSDCAQHLDDFAMQFTAQAISATLASIQGSLANIMGATADAKKAIKTAKTIQNVASIAAAAVVLGAAIASGNPATIASAASGLVSSIGGPDGN